MPNDAGVIVFASQKGGSGKTTLSGHVAVAAERAGAGPVALIDTDPQGSLAKWWNARQADAPAFARVSINDLDEGIAHLKRSGFKLIVIDTPPAVTDSIAYVVAHADLVVAPTRPSPHDLRAVGPTVDIADTYAKPLVFVVNSATARARITSETAIALSQHGVVAPVTIHNRVEFAASMIDGRTVSEIRPDSKSAQEIATLWRYLQGRLARLGIGADIDGVRDALATAGLTPSGGPESFDEDDEDSGQIEFPDELGVRPPGAANAGRPAAPAIPHPRSAPPRPRPAPEPPAANGWDGVERRSADRGPPAGQPDRRRAAFGRRGVN